MVADHTSDGLAARLSALEAIVKEREAQVKERFDLIAQSTELAADTLNKRLESMNEFRESLKDLSSTFAARTEIERAFNNLRDRLQQVAEASLQKDVYNVQHEQLQRMVSGNDVRLYKSETDITAMKVVQSAISEQKKAGLSATAVYFMMAGVLFSVLTSLVTVLFNVVSYIHH